MIVSTFLIILNIMKKKPLTLFFYHAKLEERRGKTRDGGSLISIAHGILKKVKPHSGFHLSNGNRSKTL